jgi:AraC family transcriptional regulator of adaptative response / DNA-3-methyladenine glycosylase II
LSADPVLGRLIRTRPGLAVPGAWHEPELRAPKDTARQLGTPVPGLPGGLTHTFPAAVPEHLLLPRDRIAYRLGDREAFPYDDPSVRAAMAELGATAADVERWRPWLALAAVHLLAYKENPANDERSRGSRHRAQPVIASSAAR